MTKGWRREPARHALAAKGIKTGRTPFWSGRMEAHSVVGRELGYKWPALTHDEMIAFLKRLEPLMEQNGIHSVTGDCGHFAEAMGRIIGGVEYVASYEDEWDYEHGEPTHTAFKYNGHIYDATGETTEENLLGYAQNEAEDKSTAFVITTFDENDIRMHDTNPDAVFWGEYNPKHVDKIERIMKKVLSEGSS